MPKIMKPKPLPNANFQPPVIRENPNAWVDQVPVGRYTEGPGYEQDQQDSANSMAENLPEIIQAPTSHSVIGLGGFSEILTGQLPAPALQAHQLSQLWHSIGGTLTSLGKGLGSAFMKVWDSRIGSALLVGGLITLAIYLKTRGNDTATKITSADFPTVRTTAYTKSATAQARKQALDTQAQTLVSEGVDAQAVDEARQRAAFVLETPVATQYVSNTTREIRAARNSVTVAGKNPSMYVGLKDLPMDAFLDSMQKPERAQDTIDNSALMHGLQTK